MAATTTFRALLTELAEQTGVGYELPEIDPDDIISGQLTLASSYGSGAWAGQRFPRGSPIFITSPADGGTATASSTTTITDSSKAWTASEWINFVVRMGNRRAVITANTSTALTFAALDAAPTVGAYSIAYPEATIDIHTPSTGVIAVLPAWGATDAAQVNPFSALVITDKGINHADRLKEAVNRALIDQCYRWEMRPLTFVPDGNLQGATVTDYWTAAANGTAAYASAQIFPAATADAFGQVGVNRLVQLTTDGVGSSTLTGNGIRAQLSTSQRTWYFLTAIRLVSGTGTASFVVRDNTNSADITLQVTRGNDSQTLTTTTFGDFLICEGTLQLPATCAEIAPRLVLSAATMVGQMAPVIMFPLGTYQFPMPNTVKNIDAIGNFFEGMSMNSPGGLGDIAFGEPLTVGGLEHGFSNYGDHLTVNFNFRASRPIWYQEAVFGSALTAMTDTTTFAKEYVIRAAKFELYKYLAERDPVVLDPNNRPIRSPWERKAVGARRALWSSELVHVVGRR